MVSVVPVGGQTTTQYVGPDGGLWSEPTNWNNGVPANTGVNTFNVLIPADTTVLFDLPTSTQVTGLSTQSGSRIDLNGTSLEVLQLAILEGAIINADGSGALFQTNAPFSSGANQQVAVSNGATTRLALASYTLSSSLLRETVVGPFLSSEDIGTTLDLSSFSEIDATQVGGGLQTFTVLAANQGAIDLSGTETIRGAGTPSDRLKFRAETGGTINLSSLTGITEGNTWIQLAGGTIDLTSLESTVNTRFDVPSGEALTFGASFVSATGSEFLIADGATINAPSLTNVSNSSLTLNPTTTLNAPLFTRIDNAQLHVAQGRTFAVADTNYVLSNTRLHEVANGGPFLSARDTNSTLDLSSLTEIDATAVGGGLQNFTILAADQGVVDLSNTETIKGAGTTSD